MSYCRLSCDDCRSDVYAYNSVDGGVSIYVTTSRVVFKEPLPPPIEDINDIRAWFERHQKVHEIVKRSDHVAIGLPHDGQSFSGDTLQDGLDRLLYLRELGYHVPQHAIDGLNEDIEDERVLGSE